MGVHKKDEWKQIWKKMKVRWKKFENYRNCAMSVGVKEGWLKNRKKKFKKNLKKNENHMKNL